MDDALQRLGVAGGDGFVIAALYKFVDLPDCRDWQPVIQALCEAGGVRGTLLLADEGINGTICARRDGMGRVLDWIEAEPRLDGLSLKFSAAPDQAFLRMKVRLKREIVTMGRPEISPARSTGTYVEPRDWNSLVDDPDVMVIDTRNTYETAIGTFDGAVNPQTYGGAAPQSTTCVHVCVHGSGETSTTQAPYRQSSERWQPSDDPNLSA